MTFWISEPTYVYTEEVQKTNVLAEYQIIVIVKKNHDLMTREMRLNKLSWTSAVESVNGD